jgi:hypothetical protein
LIDTQRTLLTYDHWEDYGIYSIGHGGTRVQAGRAAFLRAAQTTSPLFQDHRPYLMVHHLRLPDDPPTIPDIQLLIDGGGVPILGWCGAGLRTWRRGSTRC